MSWLLSNLSQVPAWLWLVTGFLLLLLWVLSCLCYHDGYQACTRAGEGRTRRQQSHDFNRGLIEGERRTIEHLRATGQLAGFRQGPSDRR